MNSYKKFANQKVGKFELKIIDKVLLRLEKDICEQSFTNASFNNKINKLVVKSMGGLTQNIDDEMNKISHDYVIKKKWFNKNPTLLNGIENRQRLFDKIQKKTNEFNEIKEELQVLSRKYYELSFIFGDYDE
jgi:hypothetical protein